MDTNNSKKLAAAMLFVLMAAFASIASAIPSGWTCTGNCGTSGADGVVIAPPGGGTYDWISTNQSAAQGTFTHLNIGSETNGTNLTSTLFSATAGDSLEFDFNYITSDGTANFIEYAFAQILDSTMTPVDLLFTARTTPSGNTVPGFGLPPIAATMTPSSTPILSGTTWSPLGSYSGACFNVNGCGHTGWIHSSYTIQATGNYHLLFGVVNWGDTIYDTGMAINGATVGGTPIDDEDPNVVPEPATLLLMAVGVLALGGNRRNRRRG